MPSEFKAAAASLWKLMGSGASLFCRRFNSSKCKTEAKLAVARIKLLRNKRGVLVRQMRRDVAMLLDSQQDSTARIRVEHVIREQNIMAANEIIELFCELIVVRLPIIAKQRDCPADLKEGISSLIFAAPRCSDIPELLRLRDIFEKKYGKDFVSAATDLRPESGVNRTLIEKLSVRTPGGEVKLKVMKDIAKEYQIEWDTSESEIELLKPPEGHLEGPTLFASASSMPMKPPLPGIQNGEGTPMQSVYFNATELRSSNDKDNALLQFKDTASAAKAAMELAEKATAAAQAAAHLAKQNAQPDDHINNMANGHGNSLSMREDAPEDSSANSNQFSVSDRYMAKESRPARGIHSTLSYSRDLSDDEMEDPAVAIDSKKVQRRHSYSRDLSDDEMEDPAVAIDGKKVQRRHSYNVGKVQHPAEIKFDDSDGLDSECDEEFDMRRHSEGGHPPPNRPPPPLPSHRTNSPKPTAVSRVHPKLPDYDELTARFEALRRSRS